MFMFLCSYVGEQWDGSGSVQSQVLVFALRMLCRSSFLISHRTFSQCRPGNVFSAPCVWAWTHRSPSLSLESMGLGSDRSCGGSQSAPAGLQEKKAKLYPNPKKFQHGKTCTEPVVLRWMFTSLTSSHLLAQPQWWSWGPAPPWPHCCTAPPMSLGHRTGPPEPAAASDWAPQSQSRMSHHCRAGGEETTNVVKKKKPTV